MNLTKALIKSLAPSEEVFADGFAYYKNGRVTGATASRDKTAYQFSVKGNFNYKVTVRMEEELHFRCTCAANASQATGACKHVIASLLFLNQFRNNTQNKGAQTPEEQRTAQILDYYADLDSGILSGEACHLQLSLYYQGIMRQADSVMPVRIAMGTSKYYKVQSIKKMLEAIRSGQNFSLGKDFTYRAGITEFDLASQEVCSYLIDLLEMEERYGIVGECSVFQKNEILLSKRMLLEVLKRLGNHSFQLVIQNRIIDHVTFYDGNPRIAYEIDAVEDYVALGYAEHARVFSMTADGELMFYDNVIYHPKKQFTRNYLPIYNTLSKDNPQLVFRGEQAKQFLEEVLPKLNDTMNVEIPDTLKERYLTYPLEASLYLDYIHGNLRAELRYRYGEYSFNSFAEPDIHGYILVRDQKKEDAIGQALQDCGFEMHNGYYLLCDSDGIFDFISGERGNLPELCELLYSGSFHRLRISQGEKVSYGVRMKSDEDYLSLEISYEDVPKQELKEIFRSMQLKKKYYRLKDGNFLMLDSEALKNTLEMIQAVGGSLKQMRGDIIPIERSQACYLEELLKNKGSEFTMDESIYALIDGLKNPPKRSCPEEIRANVRPYQMAGYEWLCNLAANGMGGILADDMGLGKTLQAIMFIASLPTTETSLIVCPTSLMYNWKDEVENFAPSIPCEIIAGTPEDRRKTLAESTARILITSYPLLRRDIRYYRERFFGCVFIDEAQNIKNSTSMNAMSVKQLQTTRRFALTGTPIENSLSEIWSIFDFIMPGYLFHHARFVAEYERPIMNNDETRIAQLNMRIDPFILRRMKQDVLKELPDKTEEKILVDLSEKQKKMYAAYLEHYKGEFHLDEEAEYALDNNRIRILSALMRLRQICCHPGTFVENYDGDSSKMELLLELVDNARSSGHRMLVFSQFTSMLALIKKELDAKGIPYFCIEGETKIADRNRCVKEFNEGKHDVFLISLKAGGTGLNLTGADMVIHVDPWWNPAVEDQATDRAYRIGQTKHVHVIKLLARGTIEEKIYRLKQKKQQLADSVIEKHDDFLNRLTKQELLDIFS